MIIYLKKRDYLFRIDITAIAFIVATIASNPKI